MTIYQIPNQITFKSDYISDDPAMVQANMANTAINSIVLGDTVKALNLLQVNQDAYLEQQSFRICVNKELVDGTHTTLVGVTPATEEDNEDQVYNVFNDLTGIHTKVIGTAALKTSVNDVNQQLLSAAGLVSYTEVTSIPQPLKKQPSTTGTQTL